MKKWSWLFTFLLAGILLVGCSSVEKGKETNEQTKETTANVQNDEEKASAEPSVSLQLMENEAVGKYLTDANGMTLYYFVKDEPNTTNCSGECLQNWPAFYAENLKVPAGFNKDDFGTITRGDNGEKQTTYKGYPLYYFVKDSVPGHVNGQGVKDVWYIVNTETTFKR